MLMHLSRGLDAYVAYVPGLEHVAGKLAGLLLGAVHVADYESELVAVLRDPLAFFCLTEII